MTCIFHAVQAQRPTGAVPYHTWYSSDGSPWAEFYRQGQDYRIRFPDHADFVLDKTGARVECVPARPTSQATLDHLYINQVLPLARSLAGALVFHASAIAVDGNACIAFAGPSGSGKSTLAGLFATRGHAFLTDDALYLREPESTCDVYRVDPGHPSVRLWQDSQEALLPAGVSRAPQTELTTKSRYMAGVELSFCTTARVLKAVYFLGPGTASQTEIRPSGRADAVAGWVRNAFIAETQERAALAAHFHRICDMVERVPCFTLDYPRSFERLEAVRVAVLDHART